MFYSLPDVCAENVDIVTVEAEAKGWKETIQDLFVSLYLYNTELCNHYIVTAIVEMFNALEQCTCID